MTGDRTVLRPGWLLGPRYFGRKHVHGEREKNLEKNDILKKSRSVPAVCCSICPTLGTYVRRGAVGHRSSSASHTKRLVPAIVLGGRLYGSYPHSASKMQSSAGSAIRRTGFEGKPKSQRESAIRISRLIFHPRIPLTRKIDIEL